MIDLSGRRGTQTFLDELNESIKVKDSKQHTIVETMENIHSKRFDRKYFALAVWKGSQVYTNGDTAPLTSLNRLTIRAYPIPSAFRIQRRVPSLPHDRFEGLSVFKTLYPSS